MPAGPFVCYICVIQIINMVGHTNTGIRYKVLIKKIYKKTIYFNSNKC